MSDTSSTSDTPNKTPSATDALIPIVAIMILLSLSVYLFGDESSLGANQIVLLFCTGLAALVGMKNGYSWEDIEKGIYQGISHSIGAILILFAVGAMVGTWILSGTVPTMIFWGLKILSPELFYPASCLLCALIALSIGSSWTTAGTLGIGLMGISAGMGLSPEITAGAIISGAYFGDKLSPLSETTNMASAVAEAGLFSHIRNMLWTTIPSFVLAIIAFWFLGSSEQTVIDTQQAMPLGSIEEYFNIGWYLLIPVFVLLTMARMKVPPFPAIFGSALLGGVFAVIFQPNLVIQLAANSNDIPNALLLLKGVWIALFNGYHSETTIPVLDNLLSKGGMSSMILTVWLIISAMAFGGVLEKVKILESLFNMIVKQVKGTGSLIVTGLCTCLGLNIITGDQYISIVLPGRMYQAEFKRRNLAPITLSRMLEDAGTISSPLIPWNTCGAYMAATLSVSTLSYLPFVLFNLFNIALAIIFALMNWKVAKCDVTNTEVTP
jgi:NhaC family Na+:H+ antiporter